MSDPIDRGPISRLIRFCLEQKLIVFLLSIVAIGAGVIVAPFDWDIDGLPRDRVPVDAIPDIGENQQIVFTEWPGRSPQDIDDQISYPLTIALLGIPGVKDIRSYSVFGFSTVYVVFEDDVEFYWSRSRVLEKLNSLPAGTLPPSVKPALGPDATALGQVFWYTLEGRDPEGNPTGGWDLDELRSIQDFVVKYKLAGVKGVSEVASIGGFVREYQVDVDPDAMRAAGVGLDQVIAAVRQTNLDVGARTIEVNRAEYVVRGLGFVESVEDLELTAITARDGQPILIRDVAEVALGPALRRGALTKGGVEAVGGVVVVRYGENPMATIERVKERIDAIASGLPTKVLADGTRSRLTIVPFYDRAGLIQETLDTLNSAIAQQIMITIIVVVLMVGRLAGSLVISSMLPLAVLLTFVGMKQFGVDANIVALSGIAIAIGTIVDIGIVLVENILRALDEADPEEPRLRVVHRAAAEVGGAVLTAVATTIVSFLPVFTMEAAEGKLFKPLAYTKTFALVASIAVALTIVPAVSHLVLRKKRAQAGSSGWMRWAAYLPHAAIILIVLAVLAGSWTPVGPASGWLANVVFITLLVAIALTLFWFARQVFPRALTWALDHKLVALSPAVLVVLLGATIWLGFGRMWGWIPDPVERSQPVAGLAHAFPGIGSEFMPSLDEGAFLYMPTTMPHASIGEATDILKELDRRILSVPEVKSAVGKIGRVESPLDPAPISMIETIIEYVPEYANSEDGETVRQWRDEIRGAQDIWDEIVAAARMPGVTSAPKLQPIETRIVMLQSGFRAPMGVKVFGPDLETIEGFALELERVLKSVPSVQPAAVFADRVVGKPYLEIDINRERIARYGIQIADVQEVIEVAIGGKPLTMTVEGRERYPVRVRYLRELRDTPDTLGDILVPTPNGAQVPLRELAKIDYRRGPQMVKSEDTFLVAYVLFDKKPGFAEVSVIDDARAVIDDAIGDGDLTVPAGVSFEFSGSYENQVRAAKRLRIVLPLSMLLIFLLIYLQFRRVATTLMIFSGVFVAWSGGFMMLWLYGQGWFLDASVFGIDLRELFQVRTFNLSVAVWVGFLALFGIATDDGVIMATRIKQSLRENRPHSVDSLRAAVVDGGRLRIRAAVMTSATTILALLPVLTSTGRGADVMVPMAIPAFGGMVVAGLTWFVVPVLYCSWEEFRLRRSKEMSIAR